MDFYIYTIGDAAFLHQVFIAIGSIFGISHQDAFSSALKLAMLVGVFIVVGKAVANGGKGLSPATFLASIIIYGIMFAPRTEVYIEDVYTGSVYTATDVPFGIAAVGSITSTIGITVTKWFDQAFSLPNSGSGLTGRGYINALDVLMSTRKAAYSPMNYATANATTNGNLADSWGNYIQDCTLVGVQIGQSDIANVVDDVPLIEGVRFNSEVFFTEINTNGIPTNLNCTNAYTALRAYTDVGAIPNIIDDLSDHIAGSDSLIPPATVLDNSLDAIGMSSYAANDIMATAILVPIFEKSIEGKLQNDLQTTSAIMVSQALTQRNIQWAAEQSVFRETFRPMFSFIEGMVYAISPLMAVLILMGPIGISLVGKHLLTLFWIQLWMPLLAIANMFVYISMTGEMSALEGPHTTLLSLSGYTAMDQQLSTWISTGAYMAASAPALAGFLVYGSSVALTNIGNRIQGADYIQEKNVAPDIASTPPLMTRNSDYNMDMARGLTRDSALSSFGGLNIAGLMSSAESSGMAEVETSQSQYTAAEKASLQKMSSSADSFSSLESMTKSITSSSGQLSDTVRQQSKQLMDQFGIQEKYGEQVNSIVALSMGAGGDAGAMASKYDQMKSNSSPYDQAKYEALEKNLLEGSRGNPSRKSPFDGKTSKASGSINGGIQGSAQSSDSSGQDRTQSNNIADLMQAASSDRMSADRREAMQADAKDGRNQQWEERYGKTEGSDLTKAASKLRSSQDNYQRSQSENKSWGVGRNIDAAHLSKDLAPQADNMVQDVNSMGSSALGTFNNLYNRLASQDGGLPGKQNDDRRKALAAALTMQSLGAYDKLSPYVDSAYGTDFSNQNASSNAGMTSSGNSIRSSSDNAVNQVNSGTSGVSAASGRARNETGAVPQMINSALAPQNLEENPSFNGAGGPVSEIDGHFAQGQAAVNQQAGVNSGNVASQAAAGLKKDIANQSRSPGNGQKIFSALNGEKPFMSVEGLKTVSNFAQTALQNAGGNANAAASEFNQLVQNHGEDIPTPLRSFLADTTSSGAAAINYLTGQMGAEEAQSYEQLKNDSMQTYLQNSKGGWETQVDALIGSALLGSAAALDSGNYTEARKQTIEQNQQELAELGYNFAMNHGLTQQQGEIFAEAVRGGIAEDLNLPGLERNPQDRAQFKQQYVDGGQTEEEQAYRDQAFEQIWEAAGAGDDAGIYLNQIGAINEQEGTVGR